MAENKIPEILPPTSQTSVQIVEHGVTVHVYRITEPELDTLAIGGSQRLSSIALLTFFAGIFISFLIALLSIPENVSLGRLVMDFFIIMCVFSGLLTIVFAVRSIIEWRTTRATIDRIRRRAN